MPTPTEARGPVAGALARILLGLKSQVYGLNDQGKVDPYSWLQGWNISPSSKADTTPSSQNRPGALNELMALPTILPSLAQLGAAGISKVIPGAQPLSDEQVQWLNDHLVPEVSKKAAAHQQQLTQVLRQQAGLEEPRGFMENALEASGAMLGQLPIPGGGTKALAEQTLSQAAKRSIPEIAKKVATSVPEYLGPTIKPSAANYLTGSLAGGALGTLAEKPLYGDLKIDPNLINTSALTQGIDMQQAPGYADGGKAGLISQALERLSQIFHGAKPEPAHIDTMMDALRNVEGAGFDNRQELARLQALRGIAQEGNDPARVSDLNDQILGRLSEIYMNPDVTMKARGGHVGGLHKALKALHKGVQDIAPLLQGAGQGAPGMASMIPGAIQQMAQSEMENTMPSKSPAQRKLMRAAAHNPQFAQKVGVPQNVAQEFFNADQAQAGAGMAQGGLMSFGLNNAGVMGSQPRARTMAPPSMAHFIHRGMGIAQNRFNPGGVGSMSQSPLSVTDSTLLRTGHGLRNLRLKYDTGGKVTLSANAIKTIKDTLDHLQSNDRARALQTLRQSKEALGNPGIGRAAEDIQGNDTSSAMQALNKMVEDHINATLMPTMAAGGQVGAQDMGQGIAQAATQAAPQGVGDTDPQVLYMQYEQLLAHLQGGAMSPRQQMAAIQRIQQIEQALAAMGIDVSGAQASQGGQGSPSPAGGGQASMTQ